MFLDRCLQTTLIKAHAPVALSISQIRCVFAQPVTSKREEQKSASAPAVAQGKNPLGPESEGAFGPFSLLTTLCHCNTQNCDSHLFQVPCSLGEASWLRPRHPEPSCWSSF